VADSSEAFWTKGFRSMSPAAKARLWLGLAAVVLLGFLIFSAKPWDVDLGEIKRLKTHHFVKLWFWPGCLFAFLVVSALGVSAGWWAQPLRSTPGISPPIYNRKWFWPMVAAAAIFFGACSFARLDHSLLHDEATRARSTMVGYFKETRDGRFKFKTIGWEDAVFDSRLPNHIFQSVLSKGSHALWQKLAGPQGFPLSEAALRVPVWIAAMAGIVFLALLLRSLGSPEAGVIAAWLLALHPWYLRYAAEARGYMIVMALLPVLLLAFARALQTGKTRWWVLMGLSQAAMLHAYVTALYIPLVLHALAPAVMFSQKKNGLDFSRVIPKWLVANLLSAAVFVLLFLPNAPQLLAYIQSDKGKGLGNVMDGFWLQNFFSQLASGVVWTNSRLVESPYIELFPQWHHHPMLFHAGIAFLIVLVSAGFLVALGMNVYARVAAIVFLLPAVLSFFEAKLRGGFLYDWYLIYLLTGVVALAALALARLIPTVKAGRMIGISGVAAVVILFGLWTQPQRGFLISKSIDPHRESVLLTRPSLDPNAAGQADILTAFFQSGPAFYDPRIVRCWEVADIKKMIQRADDEAKTLFFNFSYLETVEFEHPFKFRLVSNPLLFEEVGFLPGFQPACSHRVFRYIPGSGKDFDFSQFPDDVRPEKGWSYY
jgi:hypothetical protein